MKVGGGLGGADGATTPGGAGASFGARGAQPGAARWTALLVPLFGAAGVGKLLQVEPLPSMFDRWGLPRALLPVVGATEVVGAALLLSGRTRRVGAALLGTVAAGAVITQVVNGDRLLAVVPLLTGLGLARVARSSGPGPFRADELRADERRAPERLVAVEEPAGRVPPTPG